MSFEEFQTPDLSPIEEFINEQNRFSSEEKACLRSRIRECSELKLTPEDIYFYSIRGLTFDQIKTIAPYISVLDWCEIERIRSAKGETFEIDYSLVDIIADFQELTKSKQAFFQKGIFDFLLSND